MSKKYCFVYIFAERLSVDIEKVCESHDEILAYGVEYHDIMCEHPHFHVVLDFGRKNVDFDTVAKWFGVTENFVQQLNSKGLTLLPNKRKTTV